MKHKNLESPWVWVGTSQTASSPPQNSMLPGESPLPPKTPCIWELLHATQRSEDADFSAGSVQSCTRKTNSITEQCTGWMQSKLMTCSQEAQPQHDWRPLDADRAMLSDCALQSEKTQLPIYYTCWIMLIQIGNNIPGIPWPALLKFLIINSEL